MVIECEKGIKKGSKFPFLSRWMEKWVLELNLSELKRLLTQYRKTKYVLCSVHYWRTKAKELGNAAGRKKKVSKVKYIIKGGQCQSLPIFSYVVNAP